MAQIKTKKIHKVLFFILSIGMLAPWVVVILDLLNKDLQNPEIYHHIADAVAISAALFGLSFAVKQKLDTESLQRNTDNLQNLVSKLSISTEGVQLLVSELSKSTEGVQLLISNVSKKASEIAEATSTRFVEIFPKNVAAICNLIKNTKKDLIIVSDFAGYAHYSDPEAFFEYRRSLELLAHNKMISVTMIVYDDIRANEAMQAQLEAMNKLDWKSFAEEQIKLPYAKENPVQTEKALKSPEAFAAMLEENENEIRHSLSKNQIKIGRTSKYIPVYLWISDYEAAIMSFIGSNPNALEYSFHTKDHKLIEALQQFVNDIKVSKGVKWEN